MIHRAETFEDTLYVPLVNKIITNGEHRQSRAGDTKSIFAQTFTIDIEATYTYNIDSLVIECDGMITDVTIKKNEVTVGTIASVTTKTTGTFTTGNTVLIGQRVSLTVTSAAATYIMRGKLNITRIAER